MRKSRCGMSLEARWPPCPTGSREPWRSRRSSHLTATDSLTRNDGPPPGGSACPSPPRRSPGRANLANTALPSPAGLRPAGRLNQNLADSGIPIRFGPSAERSSDLVKASNSEGMRQSIHPLTAISPDSEPWSDCPSAISRVVRARGAFEAFSIHYDEA